MALHYYYTSPSHFGARLTAHFYPRSEVWCVVAERSACDAASCEQTCVLTHTDNAVGAAYRCMCQTGFQPATANLSQCVSTLLHALSLSLVNRLSQIDPTAGAVKR